MTAQNHIIKKQVLELRLEHQDGAYDLQNEISNLYSSEITGVLAEVCDALISSEEYIHVPVLEIDLGPIPTSQIETEFKKRIRSLFGEELKKVVNQVDSSHISGGIDFPVNEQYSNIPDGEDEDTPHRIDKEEHLIKLIRHFLIKGTLPWWATGQIAESVPDLFSQLISDRPDDMRRELKNILGERQVRTRMALQFPENLLLNTVDIFPHVEKEVIHTLVRDFKNILNLTKIDSESGPIQLSVIWEAVLEAVEDTGTLSELRQSLPGKLKKHFTVRTDLSETEITARLKSGLKAAMEKGFGFASEIVAYAHEYLKQTAGAGKPSPGQSKSAIASIRKKPEKKKPEFKENTEDLTSDSIDLRQTFEDEETILDETYVNNAGLVLLWPYLNRFFGALGLVAEDQFVDGEKYMRAVSLLNYFVDGEENIHEYNLALNKVLCGWPLNEPLRTDFEFTTDEMRETENLLVTVIEHWSALKNTSVEGLRSSFLRRNGILRRKENGWLMQVERKPFDLLLEKLPWAIGVIKTKWMKQPLHVEW